MYFKNTNGHSIAQGTETNLLADWSIYCHEKVCLMRLRFEIYFFHQSVVSSLFNREYSIITNKDDLTNEKARIKPMLKENRYQLSIFSKIFKRTANNHSLSHSQQQTQATDIQEERS